MKKVNISLMFVFAGSVSSLAQQTARQEGYVYDEAGNPIKGAKVVFERSGRASGVNYKELETDDEGRFVLTGVQFALQLFSFLDWFGVFGHEYLPHFDISGNK